MALQVRRVVTGHDTSGRAVVKIDEVAQNITSSRPGASACVVWTTEGFLLIIPESGTPGCARPEPRSTTALFFAFLS